MVKKILVAILAIALPVTVLAALTPSPSPPPFVVGFHDTVSSGIPHVNQPNSEQCFNGYCPRSTRLLDLTQITQARLIFRVAIASASANNPRLYLNHSTDDVSYAGLAAGVNPSGSLSTTGWRDTGWFTIATAARISGVYVQLMINGGDGVADPNIEVPYILFR